MSVPWPAGTATGVGSLPGTDPLEAARWVVGELPLPHLPELPDRGAHADLAGRGAALLTDLPVDLQPTGWRMVPRPSRDGQRAKDLLSRDLDALEQAVGDEAPGLLKVQVTGPWTLAASVELHRGDRVLADHAAVADLAQSLADGVALHLADLRRRFPSTTLLLQVDEPSLPAVLAAQIPTASGFGRLRRPDPLVARDRLATVLAVNEHVAVHCCAPRPPVRLLVEAGATALSVDAAMLASRDDDDLGAALEAGVGLLLGCVPSTDADLPSVRDLLQLLGRLRDRVGLVPAATALTPGCGLAGASPGHARAALARCVEAAQAGAEEQG